MPASDVMNLTSLCCGAIFLLNNVALPIIIWFKTKISFFAFLPI